jgi:hypothetical protein
MTSLNEKTVKYRLSQIEHKVMNNCLQIKNQFHQFILIKTFMTFVLNFFDPMSSATAYSQKPKIVRAEHSATAKGENCIYGPTLLPEDCLHTA